MWDQRLYKWYNRALYYGDGSHVSGKALNPNNWPQLEENYLHGEPAITHVDQLLSSEALSKLQNYLLDSTIWFDVKAGYLGTYLRDGFDIPLVHQIAEELREAMPHVFKDYPLHQAWAYKYDSEVARGIRVHADQAVVNVNLWITPDDALYEEDQGGLHIFAQEPPSDWSFEMYNSDDRQPQIYAFLNSTKSKRVTIPYRQNRVIIFNSKLLHETAAFRFRPGYSNRRINVTLLFGRVKDVITIK